ncbi:hypothetical protein C8J57DRAFT_1463686 [Mycena rebaudengoi]|nr:hypothetical protein C8J57DRAFT_1463686 [Mycena rebaudengoi]
MSTLAPIKLAIIGGGPSAFYVASRLLSRIPDTPGAPKLRIHIYDRLWAPHGLVRYGVAPDHPEVKNCTNKFDSVATDPRFRFFGNINVGSQSPGSLSHAVQVPLSLVQNHYSHLVFATGCTLPALHSALSASPWCMPALSFVHWYTQHPSAPPPPPLENLSHVSLIGNGNVALDIARILLTSASVLEKYDVPRSVLDVLSRSTVKHVSIIGRRGPLQAAFAAKELREMVNLPDASMTPIDPQLLAVPPDTTPTRQQSRILQILAKGSVNAPGTTPKSWTLEFFKSPTGIDASAPSAPRLLLSHTTLDPTTQRALPAGPAPPLPTSLVIPSLGFRAEPASPFFDPALGHLRTRAGRVVSARGSPVRNVYASGWAATGAKGVLASTMIDAYAVAEAILEDATVISPPTTDANAEEDVMSMNPAPTDELPPPAVQEACAVGRVLQYDDWKRVDAEELRRGAELGKERERMGTEEAFSFLAGKSPNSTIH